MKKWSELGNTITNCNLSLQTFYETVVGTSVFGEYEENTMQRTRLATADMEFFLSNEYAVFTRNMNFLRMDFDVFAQDNIFECIRSLINFYTIKKLYVTFYERLASWDALGVFSGAEIGQHEVLDVNRALDVLRPFPQLHRAMVSAYIVRSMQEVGELNARTMEGKERGKLG